MDLESTLKLEKAKFRQSQIDNSPKFSNSQATELQETFQQTFHLHESLFNDKQNYDPSNQIIDNSEDSQSLICDTFRSNHTNFSVEQKNHRYFDLKKYFLEKSFQQSEVNQKEKEKIRSELKEQCQRHSKQIFDKNKKVEELNLENQTLKNLIKKIKQSHIQEISSTKKQFQLQISSLKKSHSQEKEFYESQLGVFQKKSTKEIQSLRLQLTNKSQKIIEIEQQLSKVKEKLQNQETNSETTLLEQKQSLRQHFLLRQNQIKEHFDKVIREKEIQQSLIQESLQQEISLLVELCRQRKNQNDALLWQVENNSIHHQQKEQHEIKYLAQIEEQQTSLLETKEYYRKTYERHLDAALQLSKNRLQAAENIAKESQKQRLILLEKIQEKASTIRNQRLLLQQREQPLRDPQVPSAFDTQQCDPIESSVLIRKVSLLEKEVKLLQRQLQIKTQELSAYQTVIQRVNSQRKIEMNEFEQSVEGYKVQIQLYESQLKDNRAELSEQKQIYFQSIQSQKAVIQGLTNQISVLSTKVASNDKLQMQIRSLQVENSILKNQCLLIGEKLSVCHDVSIANDENNKKEQKGFCDLIEREFTKSEKLCEKVQHDFDFILKKERQSSRKIVMALKQELQELREILHGAIHKNYILRRNSKQLEANLNQVLNLWIHSMSSNGIEENQSYQNRQINNKEN